MTCICLAWYNVTVKHDNGSKIIKVFAMGKDSAINQVMALENCPRCAIIKVELC